MSTVMVAGEVSCLFLRRSADRNGLQLYCLGVLFVCTHWKEAHWDWDSAIEVQIDDSASAVLAQLRTLK